MSRPADVSPAWLPVHDDALSAQDLQQQLVAAGLACAPGQARAAWLQGSLPAAGVGLVVASAWPGASLWADLARLGDPCPVPVLLWLPAGSPPDAGWMDAALAAGVAAWRLGPAVADWPLAAREAQRRHVRWQGLQQKLAQTQAQLDERKWVDRAKGLLMRGGALSEDEAFRMLRVASMQANLRLGDVSRNVIATAHLAEAVNRAGQLRMLSQRWVKALALCVARVQPEDSAALLQATTRRIDDNLAYLAAQTLEPGCAGALTQVRQARAALVLPAAPQVGDLAHADAQAQALLQGAEALTAALEAAGGRHSVQVVNLCGRQRMLSQRLAKEALLAALLPEAQDSAQRARECAQAFEQAHAQLSQAPLSTPAIREGLAQVRGPWQRLARASLAGQAGHAPMLALARASEELLVALEQLTDRYESSLQLLLA